MTRRPKVAIVPEWYPTAARPVAGAFVREQARAAAPYADVVVIHVDPDRHSARAPYSLVEEHGETPTIRVALARTRPRQLSLALRVAALAAALRMLSRRGFDVDVLHAHVFSAAVPALVVGAARRLPVVASEHYNAVARGALSRWDRTIARWAYSRAALTCPVSDDLGSAIGSLAPRARLRTVPNSVDTTLFSVGERRGRPGSARLITVAQLTKIKATSDLLDALATLRQRIPGATLDVVGDGPELTPLRDHASALGLDHAVAFRGRRMREEVAALMRSADLFVLPSLWESNPCVVIEALASGLPIVATRVGGMPEMVTAENGILVEPGDPDQLAAAIETALAQPERWPPERLADAATRRYGFDATGSAWGDVYREVAGLSVRR